MPPSTETIVGRPPRKVDLRSRRFSRIAGAIWVVAFAPVAIIAAPPALRAEDSPKKNLTLEPPLAEVERLLKAGERAAAAERLRKLQQTRPENVDLTLAWTQLGRAHQQAGQLDQAADAYWDAVKASQQEPAAGLADDRKVIVRLTAASALQKVEKSTKAYESLQAICDSSLPADRSHRRLAGKMMLGIGAGALASGQWQLSQDAYHLAAEQLEGEAEATASLGFAWALASSGRDPAAAAEKLEAFVRDHGEHPDAPRAARAQAACLARAGQSEQAAEVLSDLLERWPDHDVARAVVRSHHVLPVTRVPGPVRRWVISRATGESLRSLDLQTTGLGLLVAAVENEIDAWTALAGRLAAIDQTGQVTADVLQRLTDHDRAADAERLATRLIAPAEGNEPTPQAREAACRWAGRSERWSMLALASESESPLTPDRSRTMAVERLFAEALMQTGRASQARIWWEHLVDQRGADDFPTLLRCAETASSVATVDQASERIAAARDAAEENLRRRCLVDMLDAELSVRRLKFDEARAALETVIRSSEAPSVLRARAQWMIGETFYLQQQFAPAIEAYRRVEGMDDSGRWIPAALVQAGKSFEQLGRTREAAVCYSNLVGRFADSPHAQAARRRLAAIRPDSNAPQEAQRR